MQIPDETFDLIVVGGGPVGLYAAYYAGMRGLRVKILENFDEAGGQPLNIYPEKNIYDIPGLKKTNGRALADALLEQLSQVDYSLTTEIQVTNIEKHEDIFIIYSNKEVFSARSVLLTTGNGLLNPRPIGIKGEKEAERAHFLSYFVKNVEDYKGKKVAILGGGDSALDWALMLEKVAGEVHLIHRRREFRAAEMTTELVSRSSVQIHIPFTVSEIQNQDLLLQKVKAEEQEILQVDKILVFYGFLTENSKIVPHLELNRAGKALVASRMRTNISGLYAAGDASDYEGKVPLIAVGFGEAVLAVNDIASTISFEHKLRVGHSSSIFENR